MGVETDFDCECEERGEGGGLVLDKRGQGGRGGLTVYDPFGSGWFSTTLFPILILVNPPVRGPIPIRPIRPHHPGIHPITPSSSRTHRIVVVAILVVIVILFPCPSTQTRTTTPTPTLTFINAL